MFEDFDCWIHALHAFLFFAWRLTGVTEDFKSVSANTLYGLSVKIFTTLIHGEPN